MIKYVLQEMPLKLRMLILKTLKLFFVILKQFRYSLLHNGGNGGSAELFRLLSIYWKIDLLNTSNTKVFLAIYSNVSMYSSSEKTIVIIMMTENDKDYYE